MSPIISHLKTVVSTYYPLSEEAWQAFERCFHIREVAKGEVLYPLAKVPTSFAFIHKGLMRAYVVDEEGNEFNKNFFAEGRFPGCMTALLKNEPSLMVIEALETCEIVEINFTKFRQALFTNSDLMAYQIHYLESHWLLEKEPKEIGYLQFEAKQRYLEFINKYKVLLPRLAQYHIASYLGITPTQLSRIKKELK